MSVLEKDIEGTVVSWAKKHNFLAIKVRFQEAGYPDRLFISPQGHTIFIEFKRPGEKPDPLQLYRIRTLQARNIPAYVCDSSVHAISILKAAVEPEVIPEASSKAPVVASIRRAISGSGSRENLNSPRGIKDLTPEEYDPEGPDYRAAESDL